MQQYLLIGEVLKPQGIHGEVKIKPAFADPERFLEWKQLFRKEGETFRPMSCTGNRLREGFAYAVLDGADSMEAAEKQRGMALYIDREHAAKPAEGDVFISDLIGCEAVSPDGTKLGTLRDVLQYGPVDTWVFETSRGRMMAPALKHVFLQLDVLHGVIRTDPDKLAEVAVYDAD